MQEANLNYDDDDDLSKESRSLWPLWFIIRPVSVTGYGSATLTVIEYN